MNMTRRQFVHLATMAGGSALLGGLLGCGRAEGPAPAAPAAGQPAAVPALDKLVIQGPMAPPTILLAHLVLQQEALKKAVPGVSFSTYKNPDQVRAGITSGELQVAAVPTYLAANLYRRGIPVQLLNVTVWGILHVLTVDDGIKGWADLKGKDVFIPFKGDMPDLVFRYLAGKNGLDPAKDLKLQYTSAPPEALQMLLAGKAKAVVLHEPVATAAQVQGKQKGLNVRPVLDLQQEWAKATGRAPRIPQAGTIVMASLTRDYPEVVAAIQTGIKEAADWVRANPAAAAELGSKHLGDLQAPVIEKSLARTPMEMVPAAAAREELEFFFSRLKELSPDIIGGDLPDSGFYYGGK